MLLADKLDWSPHKVSRVIGVIENHSDVSFAGNQTK